MPYRVRYFSKQTNNENSNVLNKVDGYYSYAQSVAHDMKPIVNIVQTTPLIQKAITDSKIISESSRNKEFNGTNIVMASIMIVDKCLAMNTPLHAINKTALIQQTIPIIIHIGVNRGQISREEAETLKIKLSQSPVLIDSLIKK